MQRYIGIDVHCATCTAVVLGPSGKKLRQEVIETNGKLLQNFIKSIPRKRYLCIEEGTQAQWLCEILSPIVDEMVVAIAPKRKGSKSDAIDAYLRAEELRKGTLFGTVYKPVKQIPALRQAAKGYMSIQGDVTRVKNRIKGIYRGRGIQTSGQDVYTLNTAKPYLKQLPKPQRQLAQMLTGQLDSLIESHAQAEEWMLQEANRLPIVELIATAPGIGPIRAAQIVAIVVTPFRFRTKRQFWAYCGLAVITRSSADWVDNRRGQWVRKEVIQTRGLNKNRHPQLKNIFISAAMTVITRMPKHGLYQAYQHLLTNGTKPNLARLTIARRIAAAALAMWKHKESYDVTKHIKQTDD